MNGFELLLAPHGGERPASMALDAASAAGFEAPWKTSMARWHEGVYGDTSGHLKHAARDRNDIYKQGWKVLVLDDTRGREQTEALHELIAHRAAQQGVDAGSLIVRFPRPLADDQVDFEQAFDWVREHIDNPAFRDRDVPLYRLIVGDLDAIPVTVQQALSLGGAVGRLAFDRIDDYRSYAEKVLRWESSPSRHARADVVLYTADAGDLASERGHTALMEHSHGLMHEAYECDELNATSPRLHRTTDESADSFLCAVDTRRPGVLVTLSHGEGAPAGGWPSSTAQRRCQGSLCLGRRGRLRADDVRSRAFLPGGVWFMHACYGAGTPARSQYDRVLGRHSAGSLQLPAMVRDSRLHADSSPFVAALPKAALCNPDGPLGFIGHVDLAWAHGFTEASSRASSGGRRSLPHAWLADVVTYLAEPNRMGIAVARLASTMQRIHTELLGLDRKLETAQRAALRTLQYQKSRAWMQRVDLSNYILLGDPAARLPLADGTAAT